MQNTTHRSHSNVKGLVAAFLGLSLFSAMPLFSADEDSVTADKPSYKFEEIMVHGNKGKESLLAKTLDGSATEKEMKRLIDYFIDLEKHEAPKGDPESWTKKTHELTKAAIYVFAKKDGAVAMLKEASNCKACHSVHKPD